MRHLNKLHLKSAEGYPNHVEIVDTVLAITTTVLAIHRHIQIVSL